MVTRYVDQSRGALTDLLSGLLAYEPSKRLTAKEALNQPFFHDQ
jgi:dual-specificity kinase